LRRAVLTSKPAGPALRDTEALLQHAHGAAATLRAHQFPRFSSLSMSRSRT
jgi:hypothetical protein